MINFQYKSNIEPFKLLQINVRCLSFEQSLLKAKSVLIKYATENRIPIPEDFELELVESFEDEI